MTLAERQEELVAALVSGGPLPPGFDTARLSAARAALLAKRAGEVARMWPRLAASYGARWKAVFSAWAEDRAPQGSLRDGWDFAADHRPEGPALLELHIRETLWARSKQGPLRRRRLPVIRLSRDGERRMLVIQLAGRIYIYP